MDKKKMKVLKDALRDLKGKYAALEAENTQLKLANEEALAKEHEAKA